MAGDSPSGKPLSGSVASPRAGANASSLKTPAKVPPPTLPQSQPVAQSPSPPTKATPEHRTLKCPKCGATAREVARFCQRCHMTLRFTCPACKHEQRTGGACEECGVNFLKYIVAVVDAKKQTRDLEQERFDRRTSLVKNILAIPLTGGLSLLSLIRPKRTPAK